MDASFVDPVLSRALHSAAAPSSVMYRVLKPGGRAVVGLDRRKMMEEAGFDRVSGKRVNWKFLTTGYKD